MTNNKNFLNICKMTQPQLKSYVAEELKKTHTTIISQDGFVFAQGTFPVLLVAHLDTVHKELPQAILYNTKNHSISSTQGIGGDDRCGVFMVFEVLKRFNCSALFCEDEEIGCVGADKFTDVEFTKALEFNYIIEFDRKGSKDAVFYDCDNPEFEKFITKEFYKTNYGTLSDISVLAPYLGCAAVNLSCGYYNAHTRDEYVVVPEMHTSIAAACKILSRTTAEDKFEYIEAKYGGWDDWYTSNGKSHEEICYVIEYYNTRCEAQYYTAWATSDEEALGKFMMDNPDRCFNDVTDVYGDAGFTY